MAIIASEIQYRLSGGASNANPLISLGGVKSSVAMGTDLLDTVTSTEATAGDIEYRCIYVHNANATLALIGSKIWLQLNTVGSHIAIGLGVAGINSTETAVVDEQTAPVGVTFSTVPTDFSTGLLIGDLPAGQHKAIWLRRTIPAATGLATETFTLRVQGDTNP